MFFSFNTVNGKDCCNDTVVPLLQHLMLSFNTVNGKDCCNGNVDNMVEGLCRFNTVNGKDCCNEQDYSTGFDQSAFQYRKR